MKTLRSASIRTQIFALAILLIVLVGVVAALTEPFIYGRHDKGIAIGLLTGRIEAVVDNYRSAQTDAEEQSVLAAAEVRGLPVVSVSPEALAQSNPDFVVEEPAALLGKVRDALEIGFFRSVGHILTQQPAFIPLVVRIDDGRALLFRLPLFPRSLWFYPAVTSGILKIVIPLILLAYTSSWLIIRPIGRFAAAAEKASADNTLERPFVAEGATELRSLAVSLNVMRNRILQMAESRTRMLSSISHDLRTPLTRLRMRAERCEQPELQRKMLQDLTVLDSMINESLNFLTDSLHNIPSRKVDLSSLLQTVATDFMESGEIVRFHGPRRLKYVCKPESITRAVSNAVGNATRYASEIDIELEDGGENGIFIRVCDNGPGLDDEMKSRVLEPFFKVDEARPAGAGGFGLGLPTAEGLISRGNGGTLVLKDRAPHGLVVEINLPPVGDHGIGGLSGVGNAAVFGN